MNTHHHIHDDNHHPPIPPPYIYNEVPYLLPYTSSKDTILGIKSLTPRDIRVGSSLLYAYIRYRASLYRHTHILLLHSPSSTFALEKRTGDQVSRLLLGIKEIHDASHPIYRVEQTLNDPDIIPLQSDISPLLTDTSHTRDIDTASITHLDVFLHAIRIKRAYRSAQHDKNRIDRARHIDETFECAIPFPPSIINTYQCIHIIDDVVTTGSTLHAIKRMFLTHCAFKGEISLLALAH